jgi:hypothetical protein
MIAFVHDGDAFILILGKRRVPLCREDAEILASALVDDKLLYQVEEGIREWESGIWKLETAGEFQRPSDAFRMRILLRCRNLKWHITVYELLDLSDAMNKVLKT